MKRTWQTNADEFAALDQGEGWPFAVLVACSVEKGTAGRPGNRRDRDDSGKVSASAFAQRAGTTADRVLRYLAAWERAVSKYGVAPADALAPNDAPTTWVPEIAWAKAGVYDASKAGGRPRDAQPAAAAKIIERHGAAAVVEQLTPAQRREVHAAVEQENERDHELSVIAGGGRVPTLSEINKSGAQPVSGVIAHNDLILDGCALIQSGAAKIRQAGQLSEQEQEHVRRAALLVLDLLPEHVEA